METPGLLWLAPPRPVSDSLQQTPCPHGVIADRLCHTTVTGSSLAGIIKQWAHPCPAVSWLSSFLRVLYWTVPSCDLEVLACPRLCPGSLSLVNMTLIPR